MIIIIIMKNKILKKVVTENWISHETFCLTAK